MCQQVSVPVCFLTWDSLQWINTEVAQLVLHETMNRPGLVFANKSLLLSFPASSFCYKGSSLLRLYVSLFTILPTLENNLEYFSMHHTSPNG